MFPGRVDRADAAVLQLGLFNDVCGVYGVRRDLEEVSPFIVTVRFFSPSGNVTSRTPSMTVTPISIG